MRKLPRHPEVDEPNPKDHQTLGRLHCRTRNIWLFIQTHNIYEIIIELKPGKIPDPGKKAVEDSSQIRSIRNR